MPITKTALTLASRGGDINTYIIYGDKKRQAQ